MQNHLGSKNKTSASVGSTFSGYKIWAEYYLNKEEILEIGHIFHSEPESFLEAVTGKKHHSIGFDADQARAQIKDKIDNEENRTFTEEEQLYIEEIFEQIQEACEKEKFLVFLDNTDLFNIKVRNLFKNRGFYVGIRPNMIGWKDK